MQTIMDLGPIGLMFMLMPLAALLACVSFTIDIVQKLRGK